MSSILTSTKKVLGIAEDYTAFDQDVIMYINGAFSTLTQMGLGPEEGFEIVDSSNLWEEYTSDPRLNSIKNYIYLRVRVLFDPPGTSYLINAMEKQIQELEWRLNIHREYTNETLDEITELIIDGGNDIPEGSYG